jgi:glycosyltransferase involved in cell wall biosynthesis
MSQSTFTSASVVVPVSDGWTTNLRCLLALAERSGGVRREVIVVDNGSTDETQLALPRLEGVRVIRNERDEGFAHACNQAAAGAQGDVLVFLDRDAEVGAGWLQRLAAHFADPAVAAVCPGERHAGSFLAVRAVDYRDGGGLDERGEDAADRLLGGILRRGRRIQIAEDVPVQMAAPSAASAAPAPRTARAPLSIVVPARDAAKTLAACLQAIGANLRTGDEVVIADGGSEDDTLRCAFEFAAQHYRSVKVVQAVGGVTGAVREGLRAAGRELALVVHPRVAMPGGFVDETHALLVDHGSASALAVQVPGTGVCVLGRPEDLRQVADAQCNAFFKDDGVDLGRALQRVGAHLAYVPASDLAA